MKICIVANGHLESVISLAKYLSEKDEVSLFCIYSGNSKNAYAIDLSDKKITKSILCNQECKTYLEPEMLKYIDNSFTINFVFFKSSFNIISNIFAILSLRKSIDQFKPEIINIVGHSYLLRTIHKALWSYPRVHTTHEVNAHHKDINFSSSHKLLKYLVKRKQYFIFPGKITLKRFNEIFHLDIKHSKHIHFGKFQIYKLFTCNNISTEENTVLFFGNMLPYKGLKYLIEAIQICKHKIPEIKLIIAGAGRISESDDLSKFPYIEIANHSLTNREVATYFQRCKIVVCPYLSASSSGIPVTAYVFNKPIIASNVDGLNDYTRHMETGLLFPSQNSQKLADAIELLLTDDDLYDRIVNNIKRNNIGKDFDWHVITDKTRDYYHDIVKKFYPTRITSLHRNIDLTFASIECLLRAKEIIGQKIKQYLW